MAATEQRLYCIVLVSVLHISLSSVVGTNLQPRNHSSLEDIDAAACGMNNRPDGKNACTGGTIARHSIPYASLGDCTNACCADASCFILVWLAPPGGACQLYKSCTSWDTISGYLAWQKPAQPAPPPPSPPPQTGWPSFSSSAALKADPWGQYYKAVYGEYPSNFNVLSPKDNWLIYDDKIISAKVTAIPASVGNCPTASPPEGLHYAINNAYSPRFTSWIWHPYPYKALAANTWAEVLHEADPFGDEKYGAWFMYSPGSGVYFNTGKTLSFQEHSDGYTHFKVTGNEDMCKAAAAAGYDSLQFLAHVDHVNYQCDTKNTGKAGLNYMGVEIVGAKLVGTYACTTVNGAPTSIKAGWQASKPCRCDNKHDFLNCKLATMSIFA